MKHYLIPLALLVLACLCLPGTREHKTPPIVPAHDVGHVFIRPPAPQVVIGAQQPAPEGKRWEHQGNIGPPTRPKIWRFAKPHNSGLCMDGCLDTKIPRCAVFFLPFKK